MDQHKLILALVDDHPIIIEGLKSLFNSQQDRYTLHCFCEGHSILSFLQHSIVDVILLDIALPDTNGVDLCKMIKGLYPDIIVIGLSNRAEQSTILQMLHSGASGFLLKDVPTEEILNSITDALLGEVVLSKEVRKILATPTVSSKQLPSLTKREKQLLQLLAQGKTTVAAAEELFLSKLTVDTYRKNLLQKFGVKNISELLMLLVDHNML